MNLMDLMNLKIKCEKCGSNMHIMNNINVVDNVDNNKNKYYFLCKECIKNIKICSKSKCKSIFALGDQDLSGTKIIYIGSNCHFYIYDDIIKIIDQKYGSLDTYKVIRKQKQRQHEVAMTKRNSLRISRENELKELFRLNKLEFKNYGDCYLYIKYGKPDANVVLSNELTKSQLINNRRSKLAFELDKLNIPIDESLRTCYDYIYNLTDKSKSIRDTVRNIEIEHFFKHQTDYDKLCNIYPHKKAQEIALLTYLQQNNGKSTDHVLSSIKYKNTHIIIN